MKRLFAILLLTDFCFAGSLTFTGPESVSMKDDDGEVKAMHQFLQKFADTLKSGLANSPKSELKGNWKLEMNVVHGSATLPEIAEYIEIQLSNGRDQSLTMKIPYVNISKGDPAQLAGLMGKALWKYMTTGKIERIPSIPSLQPIATVWPARITQGENNVYLDACFGGVADRPLPEKRKG
jgi:hypothetical protein